jgi:LPXTG-motif cell wall-anchored protein
MLPAEHADLAPVTAGAAFILLAALLLWRRWRRR